MKHQSNTPLSWRGFLCLALLAMQLLVACSKKNRNADEGPPGNNPPGSGIPVLLKGTVVDENGRPIPGAVIKTGGEQATTADNGTFGLANVKTGAGNVLLVDVSKTGYRSQIRRLSTEGNNASMYVTLPYKDVTTTFTANTGCNAVLPGGVNVEIPADAVVKADGTAYTGSVQLAVQHLSPDDPDFSLKIPGGDLSALRTDNTPVVLYSYGMVDVEMTTPAGDKLQLKTGKTSKLKFPIAASQLAAAPATIPLWHFDEGTGVWKEEGTATKTGNAYVGTVGHFSTWNVDVPVKTALVKGKLTDACANNVAIQGVVVTVGQISTQTDNDGNYFVRVPSGRQFTIRLYPRQNMGRSITKNIPALAEGATSVQDIALPCSPAITGRIVNCNSTPFATFVTMEHNNQVIGQVYTDAENKFRLYAPKNANVVIKAFNPSGAAVSTDVHVPDNNDVKALGDIEICSPDINLEATFTVQFKTHNQPYIINGGTAIGVTDGGGRKTTCTLHAGQLSISLEIPGMAVGNYQSGKILLEIAGERYFAEQAEIKVTLFGVVEQLIEGTFSGTASPLDGGGDKVNIVNGKFTVRRVAG